MSGSEWESKCTNFENRSREMRRDLVASSPLSVPNPVRVAGSEMIDNRPALASYT